MMRTFIIAALAGAALSAAGCSGGAPPKQAVRADGADADVGKRIYLSSCTTCHATDPAADGPLGPPVKGASKELLQARVIDGTYPPGYVPKRDTQVMKPLPQLADGIDDLAAYLQ